MQFIDMFVFRYGLPVNFQAMLLQPMKSTKKLREVLNRVYSHLDSSLASGAIEVCIIYLVCFSFNT